MENLGKDIWSNISHYLNKDDLFHIFTTSKTMHQYISIFRKKYKYDYTKIQKHEKEVEHLIIRPQHLDLTDRWRGIDNWMDKIYTKIFFGKSYQVSITEYSMFHSREHQVLVKYHEIQLCLFVNLKEIEFDKHFNQELNFTFPPSVKSIKFGSAFNQSIDHIGDSIQKIDFGHNSSFRQTILTYPKNLKYIRYGHLFRYDINHLPDSVLQIDMSLCMNSQLITKLPDKLERMIVWYLNIECEVKDSVKIYYKNEGWIKYKNKSFETYMMKELIKDFKKFVFYA